MVFVRMTDSEADTVEAQITRQRLVRYSGYSSRQFYRVFCHQRLQVGLAAADLVNIANFQSTTIRPSATSPHWRFNLEKAEAWRLET